MSLFTSLFGGNEKKQNYNDPQLMNWQSQMFNYDPGLGLRERVDRLAAQLAADAAGADAAERQLGVALQPRVDPDRPGAQSAGGVDRLVDVARPDAGRQAERRAVADLDRV